MNSIHEFFRLLILTVTLSFVFGVIVTDNVSADDLLDGPVFNHPNFEKLSESPLYKSFEPLAEDGQGVIFETWGIQEADCADCGTLFLMTYRHNDEVISLGSGRCDTLFEVTDDVTNGFKDIKCVSEHPRDQAEIVHILRYCDSTGKYETIWPDGSQAGRNNQCFRDD